MLKIRLAVAALCFALVPAAASAQVSYESRGYGGPLGIGPNFQQGGQHAPPVYGSGQERSTSVERYRAPQHVDRVQRKRNTDDDDVKTAKKSAGAGGVERGQGAERELEHRHHRLRSREDHAGDGAAEDRPCEVGQVEVQQ